MLMRWTTARYSAGGLASFAVVALAACQSAPVGEQPAAFETVAPDDLAWTAIPGGFGAAYAVVRGDPSKPGTYVIRVRFPAGVMDLPHSHTGDRHVTVLEGTWHAGTGPEFDPDAAEALVAGSYMFHPAGGVHWDGAAGEEDAVVQIIGTGPVETLQAHGEASDWVRVSAGAEASEQGEAAKHILDALPEETMGPGLIRQHVHGSESTFSRWTVKAGAVVPLHNHANEQVTVILSGAADVVSGDRRFTVSAGEMIVFPPDTPHAFTFTEDTVALDFFAPRRQDWIEAAASP